LDFARIADQAKELWARPFGKWLFGGLATFIIVLAVVGFALTRPQYVAVGTFDALDAPRVAQKLNDSKITYTQSGSGYTFNVSQDDVNKAKLVLAELNLEPNSIVWAPDPWTARVSWSQTDFDKRQQWVEQLQANLTRAIKALSAVDQARVQISVPMDKPLFKDQETAPKATVVVLPKRGQELTLPVVEAMMATVAGGVEGLDRTNVVVVDASKSKVVSDAAFKNKALGSTALGTGDDQLAIIQQYQEHYQQILTQQLERVLGTGNVSVLVNPVINWDRVVVEAKAYNGAGPNGEGIKVSTSDQTNSSTGLTGGTIASPAGVTPNADPNVPGYTVTPPSKTNTLSQDESNKIVNYLVNQTTTTTDNPGQGIEEIAVGVFVNQKQVDAATQQTIQRVVSTAMTSKARVEVAAMPFSAQPWDNTLPPIVDQTQGTSYNWLVMTLVIATTLGGIAFFFAYIRPRRPVLEPVFAGPEAAMMGGIPVSDFELAAAADAYAKTGISPDGRRTGVGTQDVAEISLDEASSLGDDFLQKMGVDPNKSRMKEKVDKIVKGNPEAVANLVKAWISDS
jgi:flagellar M-ring protein FliF